MNPSNVYLKRGGTQYRLHDKVMQIKNDYDKEVFNGDIGIIANVDTEESELTVDFDGRRVTYDVTELDELVLAYATTIHKSQGSEYPIVVMPFTMSHYIMLQRNLLYTGVTRAKKILVLIGEKKAIAYATRNETTTSRNTKLAERIANGWKDAVRNSQRFLETDNGNASSLRSRKLSGEDDAEKSISHAAVTGRGNGTSQFNSRPYTYDQEAGGLPMVAEKRIAYGTMLSSEDEPFGNLFARLDQSKFRSSFSLKEADKAYVRDKGMDKIRSHACDFISKRLAPAEPVNDGKQTPMIHVRDLPRQIMDEGHASPLPLRSVLNERHWRSAPHERAIRNGVAHCQVIRSLSHNTRPDAAAEGVWKNGIRYRKEKSCPKNSRNMS